MPADETRAKVRLMLAIRAGGHCRVVFTLGHSSPLGDDEVLPFGIGRFLYEGPEGTQTQQAPHPKV